MFKLHTQNEKIICTRCNGEMFKEENLIEDKWVCPNCGGIIFPQFSRIDEHLKAVDSGRSSTSAAATKCHINSFYEFSTSLIV